MPSLDRRGVLGCAALYGVAGPILSACVSDRADDAAGSGGASSGAGGESGAALVAADDVPVGGGVALLDQQVVVVQPEAGDFKAYTNICTHQGGAITKVDERAMVCSLHGSRFAIEDGDVEKGPATVALPQVEIRVEGGQVVRA